MGARRAAPTIAAHGVCVETLGDTTGRRSISFAASWCVTSGDHSRESLQSQSALLRCASSIARRGRPLIWRLWNPRATAGRYEMHVRWVAPLIVAAVAFCEASATQTPDKVDFARDVQPIFRQHCVGCHGATIHQAGLRLDRRSDAMRGGTLTPGVIHPGDGGSSFLYMKLSGAQFGPQMPPTGPLLPEQIAIVKRWIDEGAEWPDALAGDDAPVATPPLMTAVLTRDTRRVRKLLDDGADPNGRNAAGATALLWAADDLEMTRLLLEYGGDVSARSDDGRTPILAA